MLNKVGKNEINNSIQNQLNAPYNREKEIIY